MKTITFYKRLITFILVIAIVFLTVFLMSQPPKVKAETPMFEAGAWYVDDSGITSGTPELAWPTNKLSLNSYIDYSANTSTTSYTSINIYDTGTFISFINNCLFYDNQQLENITYDGITIILQTDIELSAYNYVPPQDATFDTVFEGTFLGNGHTISGFYTDNASSGFYGLFGRTNRGIIDGVQLENFYMNSVDTIGAFCEINEGIIVNSSSFGCLKSSLSLGGIAYQNEGIISNCGVYSYYFSTAVDSSIGCVANINNGTISNTIINGLIPSASTYSYTAVTLGTDSVVTKCFIPESENFENNKNDFDGISTFSTDGFITNYHLSPLQYLNTTYRTYSGTLNTATLSYNYTPYNFVEIISSMDINYNKLYIKNDLNIVEIRVTDTLHLFDDFYCYLTESNYDTFDIPVSQDSQVTNFSFRITIPKVQHYTFSLATAIEFKPVASETYIYFSIYNVEVENVISLTYTENYYSVNVNYDNTIGVVNGMYNDTAFINESTYPKLSQISFTTTVPTNYTADWYVNEVLMKEDSLTFTHTCDKDAVIQVVYRDFDMLSITIKLLTNYSNLEYTYLIENNVKSIRSLDAFNFTAPQINSNVLFSYWYYQDELIGFENEITYNFSEDATLIGYYDISIDEFFETDIYVSENDYFSALSCIFNDNTEVYRVDTIIDNPTDFDNIVDAFCDSYYSQLVIPKRDELLEFATRLSFINSSATDIVDYELSIVSVNNKKYSYVSSIYDDVITLVAAIKKNILTLKNNEMIQYISEKKRYCNGSAVNEQLSGYTAIFSNSSTDDISDDFVNSILEKYNETLSAVDVSAYRIHITQYLTEKRNEAVNLGIYTAESILNLNQVTDNALSKIETETNYSVINDYFVLFEEALGNLKLKSITLKLTNAEIIIFAKNGFDLTDTITITELTETDDVDTDKNILILAFKLEYNLANPIDDCTYNIKLSDENLYNNLKLISISDGNSSEFALENTSSGYTLNGNYYLNVRIVSDKPTSIWIFTVSILGALSLVICYFVISAKATAMAKLGGM